VTAWRDRIGAPAGAGGSGERDGLSTTPLCNRRGFSTSESFLTTFQRHCNLDDVLDVHRLRVFAAVVAAGSVSGAATALGYTPSAISQHLTALQRETGLVLVERRSRGIEPTPAGRMLAEELGSVFERLACVEQTIDDLRAGRRGTLTIGYFASVGASWIPPVVAALAEEFPRLRLDLRLFELAAEAPFVPDLEVFVDGAVPFATAGYRVTELLREPYVAVVPAHHRLAAHDVVPLVELREEPWVDNDFSHGPCRQLVLDACATAGFAPTFHVEAHDYPSALAFVAAGVGITVLPRLGAAVLPAGARAVPIVDPPHRAIMLRIRNSARDHPAVLRAAKLLLQQARDTAPRPEPAAL
jgi:DNA-binding transcriptional LysR family regulator